MRVIETSTEEDLSLFSRYLWQKRVRHRIFEERGLQVVELADGHLADEVRKVYQDWRAGTLVLESKAGPGVEHSHFGVALAQVPGWIRRYPVLSGLILLSLVVFPFSGPLSDGSLNAVLAALTITDLRSSAAASWAGLLTVELWRWLTPIFLHFSVLHLAFNLAVITEFSRRVEATIGSARFVLAVVVIGVLSNLGQFLYTSYPLFGGLSGVGYGLVGYVLVRHRLEPEAPAWQVHMGFAWSLLIFLVVFSTGITEPFELFVANAAHWVGLVSGAALGWLDSRTARA
ncbi:MAG: rhomboid family intramembrane serine protease [Gammaproteobacteria bacterium]|nr:MAG: rhomboid family intramembrane serine protease [Gammaproteobacteria bacterium]